MHDQTLPPISYLTDLTRWINSLNLLKVKELYSRYSPDTIKANCYIKLPNLLLP